VERTYDLTEAQARYQDDLKRLRGRRGLLLDLLLEPLAPEPRVRGGRRPLLQRLDLRLPR
jgi:hypothetical protein